MPDASNLAAFDFPSRVLPNGPRQIPVARGPRCLATWKHFISNTRRKRDVARGRFGLTSGLQRPTRVVRRVAFRKEELGRIVAATGATGATPWQTLSRVLQELRDDGLVEFLTPGKYLLLDAPIDAEVEPLSSRAIDFAILAGRLRMGHVETAMSVSQTRRRRGQARLRQLAIAGSRGRCAVCDVSTSDLLVASHIASISRHVVRAR